MFVSDDHLQLEQVVLPDELIVEMSDRTHRYRSVFRDLLCHSVLSTDSEIVLIRSKERESQHRHPSIDVFCVPKGKGVIGGSKTLRLEIFRDSSVES